MSKRIIVTAYTNSDLDGAACAIAYAELLNKNGTTAIAALSGTPHIEAQFVFKTFNISQPINADEEINPDDLAVLTDASNLLNISQKINPNQVIEIIDHRSINDTDKFPNAKVQIELVGSCATLIAEKFKKANIDITESSAVLLYSAVISNTVNFKANVTTQRDKDISEWLLTKFSPPDNYIHAMFKVKSTFNQPIKAVFESDFAQFIFNEKRLGIAQLEIVDSKEFILENNREIHRALETIKNERKLDYIFLSIVEIEDIKNIFFAFDEKSQQLVQKALGVTFTDNLAYKEGISMRKTITPLIKRILESN